MTRKMTGTGLAEAATEGAQEGDETVVSVTLGAEKFAPIQYHLLEIGPFTASTKVRPGETLKQAAERLLVDLRAIQEAEFKQRSAVFLDRVRSAGALARGGVR